ncbi:Ig-like domain repeat protein [Granulicella tundricola]|uniref:Ig-like domain repeat protein n=1 Tax=Granulicella tundricola TaxID=940615 RepID=UPI0018DB3ADF|nr:Ig-like domain repeat protein [Granulicella tundricola]
MQAALLLTTATLGVAQSQRTAAKPLPQITHAVDESQRARISGGLTAQTATATDQGALADGAPLDGIILMLKRTDAQEQVLQALMAAQQTPASPEYHHWLTPDEFGARFGVADQDLATVSSWLGSKGFKVDSVARSRMSISFSGTAGQLKSAFSTEMHQYLTTDGTRHHAANSELSMPEALTPVVQGIASLSDFRLKAMHKTLGVVSRNRATGASRLVAQSTAVRDQAEGNQASVPQLTNAGSPAYVIAPADFATMHNVTPLWNAGIDGTGQTIAIVAKSDVLNSDVDSFRSSFGLPATKLNHIYVGGQNPGLASSEVEAVLDVEWSGAVAKNATIDLVVASDSATTDGIILSAQYIVDNNVAPILSMSWGECELGMGASEAQYVNTLWQQAAAQGVSVIVATGDAGSDVCDQGSTYGVYGLSVNGFASTPYNVALGGTDLNVSYTNPAPYWNTTNASGTMQSAKSYIPEVPWNDGCGNPLILAALQAEGVTDATTAALCNDSKYYTGFHKVEGGSGGASNCTVSTYVSSSNFTCTSGVAKPSWQTAVPGIPTDGVRDLPDVSLFAGSGLWGSAYAICESDQSPDGTCDFTNPADVAYLAAGGTSFGTPAFAGIMALVNQKQSSFQGNPNPVLYQLAARQYNNSTTSGSCTAENAATGNSCYFYDTTKANNAAPCYKGSKDCVTIGANSYGIQSGWNAGTGYDLATGLGSLNVSNLVNNWSAVTTGTLATTSVVKLSQATIGYGSPISGTITVASTSGTPTGDSSVLTDSYANGPYTLASGTASFSAPGLPAGTHAFTARYAGDGTYLPSTSAAVSVVVSKAASTLSMALTRTSVTSGDFITVSSTIGTAVTSSSPTGLVTFTNSTTGATLGTATAQSSYDTAGHTTAIAGFTFNSNQLVSGKNIIMATYAGDGNYTSSSASSVTVTYVAAFNLTAAQTQLAVPTNSSASIALTLTPSGTALTSAVQFSCPTTLPAFLSCSFSPAVLPVGTKTTTTTLTLYAAPMAQASVTAPPVPGSAIAGIALAGLFFGLSFGLRKLSRGLVFLVAFTICLGLLSLSGCAGKGSPATSSVALTASAPTVAYGQSETFTASISNAPTATGQISFVDGGKQLGTQSLSGGTTTLTTTRLAVGVHSVTAVYSGDSNFATATSTAASAAVTYSLTVPVLATDNNGNAVTLNIPVVIQ